jgi:hypothetical protein
VYVPVMLGSFGGFTYRRWGVIGVVIAAWDCLLLAYRGVENADACRDEHVRL